MTLSVVPDPATTLAPAVGRQLPAFLSGGTVRLSFAQLHPTEDLRQSGRPQRSGVRLAAARAQPRL